MERYGPDESKAPFGWVPGRAEYQPLWRLFDCAIYRRNLEVICGSCGHRVILDAPGRWWFCEKRGKDDRINTLKRRLFCSKCLETKGRKIRPSRIYATDKPATEGLWPGPTDSEWKRYTNRIRS